MSNLKTLLSATAFALALPLAAQAATLKTINVDYGNDFAGGEVNPSGDDPVGPDFVRVRDTSTTTGYQQFVEIFDFTDLAGATIDSLEVTLVYTGIAVSTGDPVPDENWFARILGTDNAVTTDDTFVALASTGPITGTLTFTIDAATDLGTGTSGFAQSVAANVMRMRFREESAGDDDFRLFSSQLVVSGTPAPIPLPASGLLLLGALGGTVALRRRRKAA